MRLPSELWGSDQSLITGCKGCSRPVASPQGHYAEAEPLYKRSLAIREKALGPEHPAVATSLNNLAGFYLYQGRHAGPVSTTPARPALGTKA